MLHRRLVRMDGNPDTFSGIQESLNETGIDGRGLVVRGTHLLNLDYDTDSAARWRREEMQSILKQPLVLMVPNDQKISRSSNKPEKALPILPANMNLLTLEKLKSGDILLRLEHMYDAD